MGKLIRVIATILVIAVLAAAVYVLAPKLAHTCDNCAKFFVGTGYSANIVSNTITAISGQESKVLCKECAAKEHALSIAAGMSLNDFKLPLFEEPVE